MFAIGLAAFGVFSLACALAPTIEVLIGARALQGAAAALMVPSSLAVIVAGLRAERASGGDWRRPWTAWGGIAAIVGPLAGGVIVDQVLLAVDLRAQRAARAGRALGLVLRAIPGHRASTGTRRVDFLGAALCAAGLAGIVFALIEQPQYGWRTPSSSFHSSAA